MTLTESGSSTQGGNLQTRPNPTQMNSSNFRPAIILIAAIGIGVFAYLFHNRKDATPPGQKSEASSLPLIKCGFETWMGFSGFYIADQKGLFEKHGLRVQISRIEAQQDKNAAMARGDIDVMGATLDSSILSKGAGIPARIVYALESSPGNDAIIADNRITSFADLKGKKLAVEFGYVEHLLVLYVLQQNKIDVNDVQLVGMPNDQAVLAFKGHSVDAIATYEPLLSQAASRPDSHRLVDSSSLPRLFSTVAFASDKLATEQPAVLKAFIAALAEAEDYWKANPQEAIKAVALKWGIPESEALDAAGKTIPFSSSEQAKLLGDGVTAGTIVPLLKTCHDIWRSTGLLKADVDYAKLVDGSFLPSKPNAK